MSATDLLLKVRFNDLVYGAKHTSFDDSHLEFLQQFANLMKDKSDTQVTICPVAIYADIGLISNATPLSKEQITALNELSESRFHNFKKFMIDQYQLESSRLLFCSPQIDSDEKAVPRLAFST